MKFSDHVCASLTLELECIECGTMASLSSGVDSAPTASVDPKDGLIWLDVWIDMVAERAERTLGWVVCEEGDGLLCNECKNR